MNKLKIFLIIIPSVLLYLIFLALGTGLACKVNHYFLTPFIIVATFAVPPILTFTYSLIKKNLNNQITKTKPTPKKFLSLKGIITSEKVIAWGWVIATIVYGYQVYLYLKFGKWHAITIITFLQNLDCQWALIPNDWIGIWKIFNNVEIVFVIVPLFYLISFIPRAFEKNPQS